MRRPKKTSPPDYLFLSLVIALTIFGLVMLTSASSDLAQVRFGDTNYYLTHQLKNGLFAGIIGFIFGFSVYYRVWEKLSTTLLIITVGLILLIFLTPLGLQIKGAERWLSLGPVTFQPGELLKLTFLIYIAAWIARSKERVRMWSEGLFPFLIILAAAMGLLILQPATTTALILGVSALAVYFAGGARYNFVAAAVLLAVIAVSVMIYITPYRLERVLTFLNPETVDPLGSGYHIEQTRIAIGAGGWFGAGFGKSTTKLSYLPEPIGDSIFAVIAEELGFIGAGLLVLAFLILIWRGFIIAKSARDDFGKLLVVGFTVLIGTQAFVNIAAISGVIPLTGVPLPFVSFGGTALAVFLTMSGIILNVSKYAK